MTSKFFDYGILYSLAMLTMWLVGLAEAALGPKFLAPSETVGGVIGIIMLPVGSLAVLIYFAIHILRAEK